MGIAYPSQVLTTLTGLSNEELRLLAAAAMTLSGVKRDHPVIDIDASWLGYHLGRRSSGPVRNVVDSAFFFARAGYAVNLILDGAVRSHTKRASTKREATREAARINSFAKRACLVRVVNALTEDNIGRDQEQLLRSEKSSLENSIKTSEKNCVKIIGRNFEDNIRAAVEGIDASDLSARGGSVHVLQAEFQADAVLAERRVSGENDLILSADSDFSVMVEDDDEHPCIVVKAFQYTAAKRTKTKTTAAVLSEFEVYAPTMKGMNDLVRKSGITGAEGRINYAPVPLFDECTSREMKAIAAVGVGCDQNPGGVPGVGPAGMLGAVKEQKTKGGSVEASLITWLAKVSKKSPPEGVLRAMVNCILYEPANCTGEERKYICGSPPAVLEKYSRDFAAPSTKIIDGPAIAECCGVSSPHLFMPDEGAKHECSMCKAQMCRFCFVETRPGEFANPAPKKLCYPCYAGSALSPGCDLAADRTTREMREELAAAGKEPPKDMDPHAVEEVYARYKLGDKLDLFDIESVPYPVLPSSALPCAGSPTAPHACPDGSSGPIKVISRFDFTDGGRFVTSPELTPDHIADIVILFAELLVYHDPKSADKKYQEELLAVLPKMVVDFAKGLRLDGAWRLLYRYIRHVLDARTPSLIGSLGAVIEHDGKTGLMIESKCRASMKGKLYDGTVAFTRDSLLAASCGCQAGSEGEEKHGCVHILPKIGSLCNLKIDGLDEHIIYELASVWTSAHDTKLGEGKSEEMKAALLRMISTSGLDGLLLNLSTKQRDSISGILSAFNVGTEKEKLAPRPVDPLKLGPLRGLKVKGLKVRQKERKAAKTQRAKHNRLKVARAAAGYVAGSKGQKKALLSPPSQTGNRLEASSSEGADASGSPTAQPQTTPRTARETSLEVPSSGGVGAAVSPTVSPEMAARMARARVAAGYSPDPPVAPVGLPSVPMVSDAEMAARSERARVAAGVPAQPVTSSSSDSSARSVDSSSCSESAEDPDDDMMLAMVGVIEDKIPAPAATVHNSECIGFRIVDRRAPTKRASTRNALKQVARSGFGHFKSACVERHRPTQLTSSPTATNNSDGVASSPCSATSSSSRAPDPTPAAVPPNPDKIRLRCCFHGCDATDLEGSYGWTRVPFAPEKLPGSASDKRKLNNAAQLCHRAEFCDRAGMSRRDVTPGLRICPKHPLVTVTKFAYYVSSTGRVRRVRVEMRVPDNNGGKATANLQTKAPSKGVASDRLCLNKIDDLVLILNEGGDKAELAKALLALQQLAELADDESVSLINESVRKSFGLSVHEQAEAANDESSKRKATRVVTQVPIRGKKRKRGDGADDSKRRKDPVVHLSTSDEDTSDDTGFASMQMLLSYVAIASNGDAEKMAETVTEMTPLEEWYLYFEILWGRWTRVKTLEKKYGLSWKILKKAFASKLDTVLKARRLWPTYVSMEEDEALRSDKWNDRYKGLRIVMWDNTNTNFSGTPSDAEVQSKTFSSYYKGNVGKGGVFLQLCGWLGAHELWMGAVSDSDYFKRSGILEQQMAFVNEGMAAFINILDRGYPCDAAAWRAGKQDIIQPAFAPSDRKFNTNELLSSAAVAADRSGNERAVKRCKASGYISRGLDLSSDPALFADAWLAWSFQVNFMYRPVL